MLDVGFAFKLLDIFMLALAHFDMSKICEIELQGIILRLNDDLNDERHSEPKNIAYSVSSAQLHVYGSNYKSGTILSPIIENWNSKLRRDLNK